MERRGSRLSRRAFVVGAAGLGLVAGCGRLPWQAQPPAKVAADRLLCRSSADAQRLREAFREGLRELGYVEGENIVIECRYAEGRPERSRRSRPSWSGCRWTSSWRDGDRGISAAKQATSTIPIVMAVSGDPVGTGCR